MMVMAFLILHDFAIVASANFAVSFAASFEGIFPTAKSDTANGWWLLVGEACRRSWMAIFGVLLLMRLSLFENLGARKGINDWDRKPALYLFLAATIVVQVGFPNIWVGFQQYPAFVVLTSMLADMSIGVEEEIWFRGVVFLILLRAWGSQRSSILTAIFVSSALFGIWHFGNYIYGQPLPETCMQVVYTFFLGIIFACLYLISGSIWVPIIAHGVFDFGASITYLWSSREGGSGGASDQTFADAFSAYGGFVALVFVLAILSLRYLGSIEKDLRAEFDL
ncbi:MAG: type II CAAX prenyl endopeptidase Rce1 family protein [Alphaproteobacteria bacterium]